MKKSIFTLLMLSMSIFLVTCTNDGMDNPEDIIIENDQFKLVIGKNGISKSLVYKPGNIECLIEGKKVPISTITEPRPYQNEIKLAYPNQETTFKSNAIRMEGDKLIIGYELIPWEAIVSVKINPDYIGFTIEGFNLTIENYGITMTEPPISDMMFLRLPVKNLGHYGDLLNVVWDDKVAVNILATDPYANAYAEEEDGYRILQAGVDVKVKLTEVGAALITCSTDQLLDKIAIIEEDYNLPHGVKSRRHKLYNASYYWSHNVTPANVEEHIKYAKMSGFRCMMIYYPAFLESRGYRLIGNYDVWRREYPNGKADLQAMLTKIKDAGITPGVHFLHSHIGRDSKYVTPIPDHRLNLTRVFTLAEPLGRYDTTIYVEQNPANSTKAGNRRVLKIGTELISYKSYSITKPYKFTGCVRGIDETTINTQAEGYMFGLLDVSEFGATSVYLDQNSDLQDEIAEKIADIYSAGFEFLYFDGSEGVNPPFWFHVSNAQWRIFSRLKPEPIFAEGAAKTHFSWHMLTGGNAFDIFKPEVLKEETAKHPLKEAPRMRDNFTRLNFGWLGYWVPGETTVGTQPDMLEYVTSRAAAWDCPVALMLNLHKLNAHPRTPDNLEVIRRWEEVRAQKWLTDEQKEMLQNPEQEHILLLNEQKEFELVPYNQIIDVADGSREVRAFIFERNKDLYVVYWHISGSKELKLPVKPEDVILLESIGQDISAQSDQDNTISIPVGKRRYIKTGNLTKEELISAFKDAKIVE
jgi:hypothetical protein